MTERIIRTFCWHSWDKWSDPFTGTWHKGESPFDAPEPDRLNAVKSYMTQRRTCKKCGKTSYRKCT